MILLVDGNNVMMRAFHTPSGDLCTKAGEPTGSMRGFLNSLKTYIEKFPETTKVVVAWDSSRSEWRKKIFPEYKGNRNYDRTPEEKEKFDGLWKQIELVHELLPSLGVYSVRVPGNECDDVISYICQKYKDENKVIISSDKDFFQLIDNNTSIYNLYKDKIISEVNFYDEYKINLSAYMGYKALIGDPSDNICGIPGIGEKTAKTLMDKYGHIDNILNPTPEVKKDIMKSKRTAKIYEPQNLQILGRNHRLMHFKYADYSEIIPATDEVLSKELSVDSKVVKDFFIRWQFVSMLTNFSSFILTFMTLGEE